MTLEGWLGRPASQWTTQSLAELVGQQEGVRLEFKKASEFIRNGEYDRNELREQLASTVSVFLNSVGGVLRLIVPLKHHRLARNGRLEDGVEDALGAQAVLKVGRCELQFNIVARKIRQQREMT